MKVIDKGPKPPGAEPLDASSPEHAAWKASVKDHEDWQKVDGGKPRLTEMHEQDAAHAVSADPERYEIVPPTAAELRAAARSRMSLDQRVAALEAAYDALVAEPDKPAPPASEQV